MTLLIAVLVLIIIAQFASIHKLRGVIKAYQKSVSSESVKAFRTYADQVALNAKRDAAPGPSKHATGPFNGFPGISAKACDADNQKMLEKY